jgi:hypothetical protein
LNLSKIDIYVVETIPRCKNDRNIQLNNGLAMGITHTNYEITTTKREKSHTRFDKIPWNFFLT